MEKQLILIIEDEVKIAQVLEDYLRSIGFNTKAIYSGEEAVETIKELQPDLIILDLMLPVMDGKTICQDVRQFSNVPIIMLTARVDEIDRLIGLEVGADDYVCKPFSMSEVAARAKVILRRRKLDKVQTHEQDTLSYRFVQLRTDKYLCSVMGESVDLTAVEFRLLKIMLSQPGRVFARGSLMETDYPNNRVINDRSVDNHVKNIRKKLLAAGCKDIIHSVYGVGYKIE